jgi:hypothetical protein
MMAISIDRRLVLSTIFRWFSRSQSSWHDDRWLRFPWHRTIDEQAAIHEDRDHPAPTPKFGADDVTIPIAKSQSIGAN